MSVCIVVTGVNRWSSSASCKERVTFTDETEITIEQEKPRTRLELVSGDRSNDFTGSVVSLDPIQQELSVAVLLPCRNEERTIAKVVTDFRSAMPSAVVYVYDNASTDATADVARSAGAVVRKAPVPGKGNVLRRMFAEVDAAIYVLADGDDTYDAAAAPLLVSRLRDYNLDMVVGQRIESKDALSAYRTGHRLGNRLLTSSVNRIFGGSTQDMLSGYRVLSHRYVKSFPAFSCGFETETEMTVHALDLQLPFDEQPTTYRDRPRESVSKLRTIPDGIKIVKLILLLCKDYRPLRFFGSFAATGVAGATLASAVAGGQLHSWTPATFAAAALGVTGVLSLLAGVILDSLRRTRREMKRMMYLALPGPTPALVCRHDPHDLRSRVD